MSKLTESKAYQYVESKGWAYRSTEDHLILETCPICSNSNWKFYMRFTPADTHYPWDCKVCGENGALFQLKEALGDRTENITSMSDVAQSGRQASPLPDVDAAHRRLMKELDDEDISEGGIDYLVGSRGYSMDIIEKYKLGIETNFGKKWIVIPFYHNGNLVYAKYRTLPPEKKEFRGVSGRECPLFNEDVLVDGIEELIFTEGEGDALSCLSNGLENVVGVPGANVKKLSWMKRLDDINPKKIYILYDNDKVGQTAAKDLAKRIGIHKCYNIVLPQEFNSTDIKDANEFFKAGATLEDFQLLAQRAKLFSVPGVQSTAEVVLELKEEIEKKGSLQPTWVTQYPSINKLIGGFEEGDLIGVMAEGKVGKTTWVMNILDWMSDFYKLPAMMHCQELLPKRMIQKWIAYVMDTNDEDITVATVDAALDVAYEREADYLFAYTPKANAAEVFDTIRNAVRRYGVKFVCFDNLQVLCRRVDNNTQETAAVCQGFKDLAMELGIVIFLIIQPNRVGAGEVVSSRNANGSSAIEKIVDTMLCAHRNRENTGKERDFEEDNFVEVEENFSPTMYIRADLTRFSPGGTTRLTMEGAKSKVVEYIPEYANRAANDLVTVNKMMKDAAREAA